MTARIAAGVLVSALIRQVEAAGGSGMVLARGDRESGAVLLALADRGVAGQLLERTLGFDGRYTWTETGPDDPAALSDYLARRRQRDPDLWVVELDGAQSRAIADAMIG
ncbi:DUF1491 family protein [Sphingomonas sp. 1P06PA]|uniref:DUF1491 family protein n=1 Tax=Sphingomonas sp. 1P06PA TaxID=554121 RepID=UPI0039A60150